MRIFCPECGKMKLDARKESNRWHWWFKGVCGNCAQKYFLSDKDADYLQPEHPLFAEVYNNPFTEYEENKRIEKLNKESEKIKLENKYYQMRKEGKLKKHEEDFIKKVVLEEKDELWRK